MGGGIHAKRSASPVVAAFVDRAPGRYTEQSDVAARADGAGRRLVRRQRFVRLVQWPVLVTMVLAEIAWLVVLAYASYEFVLRPILG